MTRREENQKIFQDTERLCKTNSRLKDSVARATTNQKMIEETQQLPTPDKKRFSEEARILISKKRSFEAAEPYARSGSKVAVHNFASVSNPGGGVVNGSGAQEESAAADRGAGFFYRRRQSGVCPRYKRNCGCPFGHGSVGTELSE